MDLQLLLADFWHGHVGMALAATAVLALVIGSFLNVVILRLPVMMDRGWRLECRELLATEPLDAGSMQGQVSLVLPPSTCPQCGHRIRPWENIPVISYLALRGRCGNCKARIPLRYPLIEILAAVLAVAVVWRFGLGWESGAALVFSWALLTLTVIDIDHQLLPDSITLPLLWLGLLVNSGGLLVPLMDAVWGAAAGYLSLWCVYWAFKLATGKDGMGYGDFKLLGALGAWLGWQALPSIILLSSLAGAVVGLSLVLLKGRDRSAPIPFGPYLAAAGWMCLMNGNAVATTWQRLVMPG